MAWWIGGSTWSVTNTMPSDRQRPDEVLAPLHRAHEQPDDDCEQRRQDPAEHDRGPPAEGQRAVGPRQDAEELPFLAHGGFRSSGFPPGIQAVSLERTARASS